MTDASGMNLREPEVTNWDEFEKQTSGGAYQRPPEPLGPDGKPRTFYLQVAGVTPGATTEGFRSYTLEFKIVKSGSDADGITFRDFASVKKWKKADGTPLEISQVGLLLKAGGVLAKPQKNNEYDAAVNTLKGKVIPAQLDWRGYAKDTGEKVNGFNAFPVDAETGTRKAILRQGDSYNVIDRKGNVIESKTLEAEVLFANPTVSRYITPSK